MMKNLPLIALLTLLCISHLEANEPPSFSTEPITDVLEFSSYSYQIAATDPDDDSIWFFTQEPPDWLMLTDHQNDTASLIGTPSEFFTEEAVSIGITDGIDTALQEFTIALYCVNTAPQIVSVPLSEVNVDSIYEYSIIGLCAEGPIEFNCITKPRWLTLEKTGDLTATLSGIPVISDTGIHEVEIEVRRSQEICESRSRQIFEITVEKNQVSNVQQSRTQEIFITPNPAQGFIWIKLPNEATQSTICIVNSSGQLVRKDMINGSSLQYDISDIDPGLYLISVQSGENTFSNSQLIY